MKKRCALLGLIAACILMASIPVTATSGKIEWQSYEEGIAMAKDQGKKVLLYFHADWCGYCKKMERSTFVDAGVVQYVNTNFIAISVNSDENRALAKAYGVSGLPTFWLLNPDSSKLSNLPGYVEAPRLIAILKYIKTDSYKTMSFKEFVESL